MLFAQEYAFTPDETGYGGTPMVINASVVINDVTQTSLNLELGVFSVDDVCRGCAYGTTNSQGKVYYNITVKAPAGEWLTYKLYNHDTNELLEDVVFTDANPQLQFTAGAQYGKSRTPWPVYFVTSSDSFTIEIDPYTSGKDNYYLIASPIGEVTAEYVEGLMTPSYDFYSFDQNESEGLEWINHRDQADFTLTPGWGYLYANNTGTDLLFNGNGNTVTPEVTLVKNDETEWAGWNLVGNPYGVEAFIDRPFYRMNQEHSDVMSETSTGAIAVGEGVFVIANEDGEALVFSTEDPGKASALALNLSSNGSVIDRAIVSFGNKQQLPKFQLKDNSTKVYIPQDGTDFAVVSSNGIGEMPVNFKAQKAGSYTFTATSLNAQFNYLHLIDNLTGNDVDLIANPSYSFNASTTDYASRFRLVFATGNSSDDSFASYYNGNLVVSNEGQAVLNIVDVLGRTISSQNINGSENVSVNAKVGVYTLQLIQGDIVKTQKIVVK